MAHCYIAVIHYALMHWYINKLLHWILPQLIHHHRVSFSKHISGKHGQKYHRTTFGKHNVAPFSPTHRAWRFQVFHSEESRWLWVKYVHGFLPKTRCRSPFSEEKMPKMAENPQRSRRWYCHHHKACQRNTCLNRRKLLLFQWLFRICGSLYQNLGWGCYGAHLALLWAQWVLGLEAGERSLGLFYLGWHEMPEIASSGPVAEKVVFGGKISLLYVHTHFKKFPDDYKLVSVGFCHRNKLIVPIFSPWSFRYWSTSIRFTIGRWTFAFPVLFEIFPNSAPK